MPATHENDYYSSVSFIPSATDTFLAIGNSLGVVQVQHSDDNTGIRADKNNKNNKIINK